MSRLFSRLSKCTHTNNFKDLQLAKEWSHYYQAFKMGQELPNFPSIHYANACNIHLSKLSVQFFA